MSPAWLSRSAVARTFTEGASVAPVTRKRVLVDGMVEAYVITSPTDSAFVANSMLSSYTGMLKGQQASGKFTAPSLRPTPASLTVAALYRIYDGKLQGMMMLQNMAPIGATSPWLSR